MSYDAELWKDLAARYKRERDEAIEMLNDRTVELAQAKYELGRLQRATAREKRGTV